VTGAVPAQVVADGPPETNHAINRYLTNARPPDEIFMS
jgi:hypothetical protein